MATAPQLKYEFTATHYKFKNPDGTPRTKTGTGIGSSLDDAMADFLDRNSNYRNATPISTTPLGQVVETKTSTEGSRHYGTTLVPVGSSTARIETDNRSSQDLADEKAYSALYKSSGVEREEGEDIDQYMSRVPATTQKTAQTGGGFTGSTPQNQSSYTGPSIVDYLSSIGQPATYEARAQLAAEKGIQGYTGSAEQNTQLLNLLRGSQTGGTQTGTQDTQETTGGSLQNYDSGQDVGSAEGELSDLDSFLGSLGLSSKTLTGNSRLDIQNVIDDVMKATGLPQAAKQIDTMSKEIEDLENKRDDEIRAVNENPWLTEGVRIATVNKITEKYEDRISNRVNRLTLMQDTYNSARQDAQLAAGLAIDQYNADRNFQMDQVQMYLDQREAAIKAYENLLAQQQEAEEKAFDRSLKLAGLDIDQQRLELDRYKASREGAGGARGLTPAQINSTVNSIAGAFDNEPIVKSYNTVQEGYQTLQSIGTGTKSPADDIAFIYAFAKIMDPNSVVREGEYNTIQKYAQTWADNFGFSAKRIFSNTNFLTADAKQKMLNTLAPKVNTVTNQYNNLYNEYQRQIEGAYSGQPRSITDYSKATQVTPIQTAPATQTQESDSFWGKVGGWLFGD